MSRILIAGCGYVGSAVADLFHQTGWEVEGWTASRESSGPYKIRVVDLADVDAVKRAASDFDVVIQCASSRGGDVDDYQRIYLEGARSLTSAFPQTLLVFTSSTSVYAQSDGEWVTEESAAEPQRETGRILREVEELVLARGGIAARLAGIYGPKRSALLQKFLDSEVIIERGRDRFINQVHRDDIATALQLLVQTKSRGVFNISDNHPILLRECYEWLAAHLKRPLPPPADSPIKRKRGNTNKRVSSEKLQALGWAPRYPTFQAAMTASVLPSFG